MAAQSLLPRGRCLSVAGVPQPRLLVSRLGRQLGSTPGRLSSFQPLVSSGDRSIHQRHGITSSGEWAPLLCSTVGRLHGCVFWRQLYGNRLSSQSKGYKVSCTKFCGSEDSALGKSVPVVLAPQFIKGKNKVLVDLLSRPNEVQGPEWTLKQEVFLELQRCWPVTLDLFATSLNHQCSLYFSPYHDPKALGTDAFLQAWDGYQVFAFPLWSLILRVLKKLRSSSGVLMTLVAPWWPQRPWFPELLDLTIDGPVQLP